MTATLPGKIRRWLSDPVDNASLSVFRIVFGAIMLWHVGSCFADGLIDTNYIRPPFHFKWYFFDWVRPLPGSGMYFVFLAMGISAFGIMVGALYRWSAAVFCFLFIYVFLIDRAFYLNHYYLTALISFILAVVPAHHGWSLDSLRHTRLRSATVSRWCLLLVQFQLGVAYFYGGIAKLTPDWLRGHPMALHLEEKHELFSWLSPAIHESSWVLFFAWGGLVFDLLVVPLLLWRRTRAAAYAVTVFFNVTNSMLFRIGYFPWFMLAGSTIFFSPGWPRRLIGQRTGPESETADGLADTSETATSAGRRMLSRRGAAFLAGYVVLQLIVPFRHHCYAASPHWTEECNQFSWHMMLHGKRNYFRCYVTEVQSRQTRLFDVRSLLNYQQQLKLTIHPRMMHQFAHFLAAKLKQDEGHAVEVRFLNLMSLNGRKPQPLTDPLVDLAAEPFTWATPDWVLPLQEPHRDVRWDVPLHKWSEEVSIDAWLNRSQQSSVGQ